MSAKGWQFYFGTTLGFRYALTDSPGMINLGAAIVSEPPTTGADVVGYFCNPAVSLPGSKFGLLRVTMEYLIAVERPVGL